MNRDHNWEEDLRQRRPLPNRGKSNEIREAVERGIQKGLARSRRKHLETWKVGLASIAMLILVVGVGVSLTTKHSATTIARPSNITSLQENNYVATYTIHRVADSVQFQVHVKKWGKGVLAVGVGKTGLPLPGRQSYNEGVYFVVTSTDPSKQVHLASNGVWAGTELLNQYMKKNDYSTLLLNELSTFSYNANWDGPTFKLDAAADGTIPLSKWRLLIVDIRQQTGTGALSLQWVKVVTPSGT